MKNFNNFINERLNREEWLSYKDQDAPITKDFSTNQKELYNYIMDQMSANPQDLIYTFNYQGGEDFTFFISHIKDKAKEFDKKTIHSNGVQMYITVYIYDAKTFMTVEVRDPAEYGFVIINKNDFDFFDYETDPEFVTVPPEHEESMWSSYGHRTPGPEVPSSGL